jgi:hypothetical protein
VGHKSPFVVADDCRHQWRSKPARRVSRAMGQPKTILRSIRPSMCCVPMMPTNVLSLRRAATILAVYAIY